MSKITIGARVAYSASFCRSIGCMTGNMPAGRGRVTDLIPLGSTTLAVVEWNDSSLPDKVNVANLALVGPNMKFAQC